MTREYDVEAEARLHEHHLANVWHDLDGRAAWLRAMLRAAHSTGRREGAEAMRERAAAHLDRRAGDASLWMSPQQTRREAAAEIRALPTDTSEESGR